MNNDSIKHARARKQKRYSSEEEVLKAIDACKIRIVEKLKAAARYDTAADKTFETGDLRLAESGNFLRKQADDLRLSVSRNEARAKKLGNVLAQIRTPLLVGMGEDNSVPG